MLNKTRPLYGSFSFGEDLDILVLISRMQQVSERFLDSRIFNSYLKTAKGNSHYGLSYEELKVLTDDHKGFIHNITASSSTLSGKGVNINIRFAKESVVGEGQFVIVAGSEVENEEIRDMLLGNWVEKEVEAREEESLQAFPDEELELPQQEDAPPPDSPMSFSAGIPVSSPTPKKAYPASKKVFYLNTKLSRDELVDHIFELFILYMDDATFDIRLLSWSGDLHLGIQTEELRQSLQEMEGNIQKLYVLLDAKDGKQIDLILSFAPLPQLADSEIKVKSDNSPEIISYVHTHMALDDELAQARLVPLKETFSFDPAQFQIESLIQLVNSLLNNFLPHAQATAFISNKGGVLYHDVMLDQLKDLFYLYQRNIHVLSLYISRAITGQSVNLVFEFNSKSGSIALQTGNDRLQLQIKSLIWEGLNLQPFEPNTSAISPPPLAPVAGYAISPLFQSKEVALNPQLCLLVMPRDPLPAEAMLTEVGRALEAVGLEVENADSIFGYLVMERLWQNLNAAGIVIADVTQKSAEVFYALGIAHTLGREVILLTQSPSDIPFDFKKYPHIIYEPNEAGYINLRQELLAYLKKT